MQNALKNMSNYSRFYAEIEDANGINYHRARYYDPRIGAWFSLDPLETPNRYAYVMGDPVNMVDLSGLIEGSFGNNADCQEESFDLNLCDPQYMKWFNLNKNIQGDSGEFENGWVSLWSCPDNQPRELVNLPIFIPNARETLGWEIHQEILGRYEDQSNDSALFIFANLFQNNAILGEHKHVFPVPAIVQEGSWEFFSYWPRSSYEQWYDAVDNLQRLNSFELGESVDETEGIIPGSNIINRSVGAFNAFAELIGLILPQVQAHWANQMWDSVTGYEDYTDIGIVNIEIQRRSSNVSSIEDYRAILRNQQYMTLAHIPPLSPRTSYGNLFDVIGVSYLSGDPSERVFEMPRFSSPLPR